MTKTGIISKNSPCEYCGRSSVTVVDGIPLCAGHLKPSRRSMENRPEAIRKVVEHLGEHAQIHH